MEAVFSAWTKTFAIAERGKNLKAEEKQKSPAAFAAICPVFLLRQSPTTKKNLKGSGFYSISFPRQYV